MELELPVWPCDDIKASATTATSKVSHISNPRPRKTAEVHSKKAKVWRLVKKYVEEGINLNAPDKR